MTTVLDDKSDSDLLSQALEKLRSILTRVNDAVAFHQNSNEFKKLLENVEPKTYTYYLIKVDKQIEQRKFTVKSHLIVSSHFFI
jgi:tRNA pseudouridine-54 N-methylase